MKLQQTSNNKLQRESVSEKNGGRGFKNKLPTLSKKDKANGKKIKQVV